MERLLVLMESLVQSVFTCGQSLSLLTKSFTAGHGYAQVTDKGTQKDTRLTVAHQRTAARCGAFTGAVSGTGPLATRSCP